MAENDYPLLVFPEPVPAARAKRNTNFGKIRVPSPYNQAQRLAPEFQRLQDAMEGRRLALQDNPLGLVPEQVLVLQTIGSIQDFTRAVDKIPGLEWLGDYHVDDISPEFGFEDEKNLDKRLRGQLFLVMTDQQALSEIHSLFRRWERDPGVSFPDGLAPLKRAFEHLHTIRPWGVEDRILETGILEDWRNRLEDDEDDVPFQAELWFRQSDHRRQQAESLLRSTIESQQGEVVHRCLIPEIAYHALLGRLPRAQVQEIAGSTEAFRGIRMLQCEDMMHARPVGQCAVRMVDDEFTDRITGNEVRRISAQAMASTARPVIALFDGMPLTGHRMLDNRLIVDDPDGYESGYQANERNHGTAMASLICHGDLAQRNEPLENPLYVRPILQPDRGYGGQFKEVIPANLLPVDVIHRATRRLFEPENGDPPVAPTVRFVNLSVCDSMRPLMRDMSPLARLLDWLSWKYQILFVVSAGNHPQDIELDVPRQMFGELSPDELEQAVLKAIAEDTRNRRLLSPAETLNGVTIGATHMDASQTESANLIDPFLRSGMPNVASAHGPGYRRAIKPDLSISGGRQFLIEKLGNAHPRATLQVSEFRSPPGQRVATPGDVGQLDQTVYTRGTSNAAAVASRGAGHLYRLIGQLREHSGVSLPEEYGVVLTKAMLAHGSAWTDVIERYEAALKTPENSRTFREYLGRFLGYGPANFEKVMNCTQDRVTVLGFGELDDDEGAVFSFPLPPSLSAIAERRRLTITLAWLSPVNSQRQAYRIAHLWFDPKNEIAPDRLFADYRAVQRGTIQHEVLEGSRATVFQDGDEISIKVNCRSDAGDLTVPVRYGLAITLEMIEDIQQRLREFSIYEEVRDRLVIRVPV